MAIGGGLLGDSIEIKIKNAKGILQGTSLFIALQWKITQKNLTIIPNIYL
jgi:hypothetical protein